MTKEDTVYNAYLELYEKKGYLHFLKVFTDTASTVLSDSTQSMLLENVKARERHTNRSKLNNTALQKEGAGIGTVATTGSGGLGYTPTHGGNGGSKRRGKKMGLTELKDFLMLSKSEEHERPVREGPSDAPRAIEFPSEMDTTVVDTQQDVMTQIEVLQDHGKDRRSRESALSDSVEPSDDMSKALDKIMKEEYYGEVEMKKESKPELLQKADSLQARGQTDPLFGAID